MAEHLNVIASGKSERDQAIELRETIRAQLSEIVATMDQANRAGFRVEFAIGFDPFGKNAVQRLSIVKDVA